MSEAKPANDAVDITRTAFMWTRILNAPFWAIFNMLPFILYKDLQASPLQITIMITLKPLVSIFSMYWSTWINRRSDRLLKNVIGGGFISYLPFFLFPFVDNPWFYVASFGFYMMLYRGIMPGWMEILKLNIPGGSREKTFANGSAFGYLGDAILPFILGWLLDNYFEAWRTIFPVAALISLVALILQYRIPIDTQITLSNIVLTPINLWQKAWQPWKNSWELIKARPDFGRYLIGFMLGGSGLIVMQPALPMFFVDILDLSYTEMAVALTFCKGIGFVLTSSLWAKWMNKIDIYRFTGYVTSLAFLFPLILMLSPLHISCLYLAYIVYGIMQAGSELSWHLSGPIFAKKEDSSTFSTVNILTVGIRGSVAPPLGSILCWYTNSMVIMSLGAVLCLLAMLRMFSYSRSKWVLKTELDLPPAS
jgi:MFS family permease